MLSIALASTFFSGINVGADTVAKQVLERQLSQVPVDIKVYTYTLLSAASITDIMNRISDLNISEISQVEVVSRLNADAQLPNSNETTYFQVYGILDDSLVYDGLTVKNGSLPLKVNETYVWTGAESFRDLELGDILQFNITVKYPYLEEPFNLSSRLVGGKYLILNLTVAGFVDLEDQALGIIRGYYSYGYTPLENILIVNWNKTLARLIDVYYNESLTGSVDSRIYTEILIFLDRESVINIWDIDRSIERIRTITFHINNIIRSGYAYSSLESVLTSYRMMSQAMRLVFVIISLPVFFIAWYMGTTVSDVSYNLRRREIGILLTKGFSRRQLLRMFLGEAVIIGLIGGIIGIGLSFLLTPFFIQGGGFFAVVPVIGIDTIIITLIFSAGLTFLSVFQPARRASKLDIVDALQEYRYVEEVKPYKRKWPWIAFILGSYKVVTWLLGINLSPWFGMPYPIYNILVWIILYIWEFFDTFVLNFIGPILFFWGFTKIFIRGSLKFQEFVAKIVKLAGDLSILSTKNVRRNPARTAAIAFLIAMITGYSFQIIGTYASERDYQIRQVRFIIGADVSVQLNTLQNLSSTMDRIRNLTDVSSITVEYRFSGQTVDGQYLTFIAVNPEEWLNIAYFESDFFTGRDVASVFQEMKNDNNTVILDRGIAEGLKLKVDGTIAVTFQGLGYEVFNLRIVGFFGSKQSQPPIMGTWYSEASPSYDGYYTSYYGSYIPEGLYYSVKNEVYPNGRILVKLAADAEGKTVAEEIRNFRLPDVSAVYSVAEYLEQMQSPFVIIPGLPPLQLPMGSVEIQRLGVAFAVLAASIGTALVTFVSLKERSREVGLMSVRGLSFKQIIGVLLTENLAVVGFAVFLGAVVGLIIVQGNISALNSTPYIFSPILHRMVFPLDSVLTLMVCCGLVFASTIGPVIFSVRRYISETERIVRGV